MSKRTGRGASDIRRGEQRNMSRMGRGKPRRSPQAQADLVKAAKARAREERAAKAARTARIPTVDLRRESA